MRSMVSMSRVQVLALACPTSLQYSVRSSAMRLVSVVTSTRSLARRALADLVQQVVDLARRAARTIDLGIDQAGRAG